MTEWETAETVRRARSKPSAEVMPRGDIRTLTRNGTRCRRRRRRCYPGKSRIEKDMPRLYFSPPPRLVGPRLSTPTHYSFPPRLIVIARS